MYSRDSVWLHPWFFSIWTLHFARRLLFCRWILFLKSAWNGPGKLRTRFRRLKLSTTREILPFRKSFDFESKIKISKKSEKSKFSKFIFFCATFFCKRLHFGQRLVRAIRAFSWIAFLNGDYLWLVSIFQKFKKSIFGEIGKIKIKHWNRC